MKKSFIGLKLLLSIFLSFSFIGCVYNVVGTEEGLSEDIQGPTVVNEFPVGNRADVLMLFYMDGDNNLASDIWQDVNEIEYGLYLAEQNGGTSAKVDIFVLWDGEDKRIDNKYKEAPTNLYKMGADSRINSSCIVDNSLSNNTLDLTGAASSWIYNDGKYEVSMSNPETLENYLRWISNHYIIDNDTQIILQFADHGAGPRSFSISDSGAGNSRAMCQDENTVGSNNQELLWTKDIPNAIKASGILSNGKKKIDLVIQDVCNGASVEEAYEYKDVAEYMLLSPSNIPGRGLNYIDLIGHLKEGDCIFNGQLGVERFLDKAVCDFINFYKNPDSYWESVKKDLKLKYKDLPENTFSPLFVSINEPLVRDSYTNPSRIVTITAVKLAYISNLQEKIKSLSVLMNDNNNPLFVKNENGIEEELKYLKVLKDLFFRTLSSYESTFATLYDIGEFANCVNDLNNINLKKRNEISKAIDELRNALENVVLYSWRDGVGGALYNKSSYKGLNGLGPFANGTYGLTISGIKFEFKNQSSSSFPGKDFYNELLFGKNTPEWKDLIINIIDSDKKIIF